MDETLIYHQLVMFRYTRPWYGAALNNILLNLI